MALASPFLQALSAVSAALLLGSACAAQDLTPASGRYEGMALEGDRLQAIGRVDIACPAAGRACRVSLAPKAADGDALVADMSRSTEFERLIGARLAAAAKGGWTGRADAAYRRLDGWILTACWAATDQESLLTGLCRVERAKTAAQWVVVMADMASSNSYSAGFVPVYLEVKQ